MLPVAKIEIHCHYGQSMHSVSSMWPLDSGNQDKIQTAGKHTVVLILALVPKTNGE